LIQLNRTLEIGFVKLNNIASAENIIITSIADKLPNEMWQQVEDIFLESSAIKQFTSNKEREDFLYKYLRYYKETYPELFFVASREHQVLGYICASRSTKSDIKLINALKHLSLFNYYYASHPAHLHINCHAGARGLGLGSQLLLHLEKELIAQKIGGLHLITSPNARNVGFYRKNGYTDEYKAQQGEVTFLLMGKILSQ
jgi:ribosomal protein S18 acetylase RimI-like enzyme